MNNIEVKKDCFGFDKTKNSCKALKELYCKSEKCRFYKNKEQYRKEMKNSREDCEW